MSNGATSPQNKPVIDRKALIIIGTLVVSAGIVLMPTPAGLSLSGQRMLAVTFFAIVMWITEAMSYGASSIALIAFILLALGLSPEKGLSGPLLGTAKAIPTALSGFVNSGWAFVAAGLFMAASITSTGIEKRIAYLILRAAGSKITSVIAGFIVIGFALTFIIPSVIARAATMVPLVLGIIAAFEIPLTSQISKAMMLCVAFLPPLTGVGVLTGSAPNPVVNAMAASVGAQPASWLSWLMYILPFSICLALLLYVLLVKTFKFEFDELPGGKEYIANRLRELGPMSKMEKRISIILALTILMWATDKFHGIDSNTIAILSVLFMVCPYIGVATWQELYKRVDWTTILLFAAGISMGNALLRTGAAAWLSKVSLVALGIGTLPVNMLAYVLLALCFVIRFGFTSGTSFVTAMMPAVLGFLVSLNNPGISIIGLVLMVNIVSQNHFIIPVNSANGTIAYGTGAFTAHDMAKIGIPFTIGMFVLLVPFIWFIWPVMGMWK
ncbi:MAG: DASS family sodium-coupled anion symporter [Negativicutes bacterium]